ncbi:MAG: long-chain fatty acid--CoA ligase, partial [Calditrichaeota bacterium]|nr:long-chain fatty acid--CoA ligase [Calditrichota bacterium]
ELLAHPQLRETIDREVQEANRQLPRFMQVRYYRILAEPFSVENGELTHTLKLRTEIVEEKYKQLLDSMYDE